MSRDRERSEPLSEFSEWHRDDDDGMPDWYKWIDVDYMGYIDPARWPSHAFKPYIIIELVHITNREKWGPSVHERYPHHEHKQQMYEELDELIDVPVYVMWHPSKCDEFYVREINDDEPHRLTRTGLCDFLDDHRRQVTGTDPKEVNETVEVDELDPPDDINDITAWLGLVTNG